MTDDDDDATQGPLPAGVPDRGLSAVADHSSETPPTSRGRRSPDQRQSPATTPNSTRHRVVLDLSTTYAEALQGRIPTCNSRAMLDPGAANAFRLSALLGENSQETCSS